MLVSAESLSGRWDGIIVFDGMKVPFSMHFDFQENSVTGSFLNGETRIPSTNGSFNGAALTLDFAQLGTRLNATIKDTSLKGTYSGRELGNRQLEANQFCTCSFQGEAGPDITGSWLVDQAQSQIRLNVSRKGDDTFAVLSQGGRDSGIHTGRFDGLQFSLSHFDGARASLLEITPAKGGWLELTIKEPGKGATNYRASKIGLWR